MSIRRSVSILAILTGFAAASACGSSGAGPAERETLTVYAASSLTGAFTELGETFEKDHPGVRVVFSFGGSSDLVAQIQQGAPADVFASADATNMAKLTADDLTAGTPQDFASNTLEIVTPPDNPAKIDSLDDLAGGDVSLVVCAPEVPCGGATEKVERAAGLTFDPVSEEQSVKDVLAKVTSGEADAGLVYVTDVEAAGDAVHGVPFDEASSAANTYPVAVVEGSRHERLARAFVALVLGAQGQRVLAEAGFAKP